MSIHDGDNLIQIPLSLHSKLHTQIYFTLCRSCAPSGGEPLGKVWNSDATLSPRWPGRFEGSNPFGNNSILKVKIYSVKHEVGSNFRGLVCQSFDDYSALSDGNIREPKVSPVRMRQVSGQQTQLGLGDVAMCDSVPVFRQSSVALRAIELFATDYFFEFVPVAAVRKQWFALRICRLVDATLSPDFRFGSPDLFGAEDLETGFFRIQTIPAFKALLVVRNESDPVLRALSDCPELRIERVPYHPYPADNH
jgi:hypothetical protein